MAVSVTIACTTGSPARSSRWPADRRRWYGDTEVRLSLGGAFHARRLGIRSSQVGTLAPARAARRTTADRLALALELLRDPAFDALLTGESRFDELPEVMARLAAGRLPALCHTITYAEN